ncbi:hypothetical protein RI367_000258 [Sorochytrium milnesiophthora]
MEVAAAQLLPQDLDDAAIWATSQVLALASGAATTPPLSDCASLYSAATATTQSPTPPPADQTTKRRRSVLKIEMPEFPSVLEKRMRGGPGRKRKGISEEEKQARQQERVLRNRISAQESRNKKRAYMDLLENAATDIQDENERLRDDNERLSKRVRTLESENSQLNTKIDWLMQQMAEMKQRQDSFELQHLNSRRNTFSAIESFCKLYNCAEWKLSLSGHSQGGVFANLMAVDPMIQHIVWLSKEVITLNSPMFANEVLAKYIDEKVPHIYRVVEWDDIVPHLPPIPGYQATKGEIWSVSHSAEQNVVSNCTNPDGTGAFYLL